MYYFLYKKRKEKIRGGRFGGFLLAVGASSITQELSVIGGHKSGRIQSWQL
jgi:hypothetical protein